jgi:hypothetical protein
MNCNIASFDIGSRNFAVYIESFDITDLMSLEVPKKRYNKDNSPTPEFQSFLKQVYKNGSTVFFECVDLKDENENYFESMTKYLDSRSAYWDHCHGFIIEEQLRKNPIAQRLEQHCYSYFSILYSNFKFLSRIKAVSKTSVLGCLRKQPKLYRKKWTVRKTDYIFQLRKNEDNIQSIFLSYKKKDDIGDTVCQLNAFKVQLCIENLNI